MERELDKVKEEVEVWKMKCSGREEKSEKKRCKGKEKCEGREKGN